MKQLLLSDCLVWDVVDTHSCAVSMQDEWVGVFDSPLSPTHSILSGSSLIHNQKEQNSGSHSPLSLSTSSAPSDYILTTLDNEIIQTITKIGKPCTPDEIMLELESQDWGVKPTTIQRHIERLGQYKIITRIKKGVYIL